MSPFGAIEFWHWWALGVVLIIVEVFAPGFVFAWLAVAAGLTGLVLFLAPGLSWQVQLLAFAGLAVASVVGWIYYVRRVARPQPDGALNRRGAQYVGRRCVVVEPIENGRGRIRVGDGTWSAAGPDAPAGARVRVVGVDGTVLLVEPDPAPPSLSP
ncbi:MAG TPA: NfeD family protein [Geminicoccaceae bacterium]|nr:NfeD family protein [Geminicoccaceae bacterium]